MPVIQVNDQQYALHQGPTRVGTGVDADVRIPGDAALGVQAIVEVGPNDDAVIRRASVAASVKVNGVPLGVEPTPLIHGDKVEIAGTELRFSDEGKGGATQHVSTDDLAQFSPKRSGTGRATTATGGRLVSLVDGKEYAIPSTGIVIGRDASSDVVVAQSEVSRRHAAISPAENGYVVQDFSTNGVFVNGERVSDSQLLSRADVLRIGTEEFRFYADLAPTPATAIPAAATANVADRAPAAAAPSVASPAAAAAPGSAASVDTASASTTAPAGPVTAAAQAAAPVPPSSASAAAPASAARRSASEPPTKPGADARPVLATLEVVNEGVAKGRVYEVRVPLAHVGRGAHNEIVIADDSVSDAHATLQRRDDGWYVADLGSTNGTYVGGTRLNGERRLEGAPDVRFGGVKLVFRARAGAVRAEEGTGTRAIVTTAREPRNPPARRSGASAPPAPADSNRVSVWVWVVAAVVVIAGILYALKA